MGGGRDAQLKLIEMIPGFDPHSKQQNIADYFHSVNRSRNSSS